MSFLRLLCFGLYVFCVMYAIALCMTKEQRAYLAIPTQDEHMAQECRQCLWDFEYYNHEAFDYWETSYGKGFTVYAALRSLEAARLPYGCKITMKGWTEYNGSRQKKEIGTGD